MRINNKGQALVEYVLIIALIAVIVISALRIFGGSIKDSITKASCELSGQNYVKGSNPGEGACE